MSENIFLIELIEDIPVKPILGDFFYFTKYLNHSGFGIRNTATYNTRSINGFSKVFANLQHPSFLRCVKLWQQN